MAEEVNYQGPNTNSENSPHGRYDFRKIPGWLLKQATEGENRGRRHLAKVLQ